MELDCNLTGLLFEPNYSINVIRDSHHCYLSLPYSLISSTWHRDLTLMANGEIESQVRAQHTMKGISLRVKCIREVYLCKNIQDFNTMAGRMIWNPDGDRIR